MHYIENVSNKSYIRNRITLFDVTYPYFVW